jgi:RNA polymerase sigma factor (sigma-70 family)
MTDHELILQFTQGSQGAFAELAQRHIDLVYSSALRQVRDRHLAEDVTQAVFIVLARKAAGLGENIILPAWLLRATHMACLNALRGESRRRRHERKAAQMMPESHITPEPVWSDISPLLDSAMNRLGAKSREALALRFFAGQSVKEVATALDISEDAAKQRLSRGLAELRTLLGKHGLALSAASLGVLVAANATQAAPAGLLASTATSALAHAASPLAKGILAAMAAAKVKVAAIVLLAISVLGATTTLAVHQILAKAPPPQILAGPLTQSMAAIPAVAALPANQPVVSGKVLGLDGKPLANAEVFLVPALRDYGANKPPLRQVTGDDGQFSFPRPASAAPNSQRICIRAEEGCVIADEEQLAASKALQIQAWATVEGVLKVGEAIAPGQNVVLTADNNFSFAPFGIWQIGRTDADGHFVFHKVIPGESHVRRRIEEKRGIDTQPTYVNALPGKTVSITMGGRGRPVVGRIVAPKGFAVKPSFAEDRKYFNNANIVPEDPRPTWLPPALLSGWEKSPAGLEYKHNSAPYGFLIGPDGSFRIDDVPAGKYNFDVAMYESSPGSRMADQIFLLKSSFAIPPMPDGRSDSPLNLGEIACERAPGLHVGDTAPMFDVTTLDGEALKLADLKGKVILLHFFHCPGPNSEESFPDLRAAWKAWGDDPRFAMVGVCIGAEADKARAYAADHRLAWTLGLLPRLTLAPERYEAGYDAVYLIDGEGQLIGKHLHSTGVDDALDKALAK